MRARRLLTVAGATVVSVATSVVVVASPASANCTNHGFSDRDKEGFGYVTRGYTHLKVGPHAACNDASPGDDVFYGQLLWYHCYVRNESGNTWTHVRKAGTNDNGWIDDASLNNNGSYVHC